MDAELSSLLSALSAALPAGAAAGEDGPPQEADLAAEVSVADCNYQAALRTTAKVRQLSLLDFLR